MKIDELRAYKKNPRKITSEDFKLLGESLKEFGDLSGIVLNRRSGELVGGNQRTSFFKQDSENCKIIVTEKFDTPTATGTVEVGHVLYNGEQYALRVVDWDEAKEERANIIANKVGGTWDFEVLANAFDVDMLLASGWKEFELGFGTSKDIADRSELESPLEGSAGTYLDGNIKPITLYFSKEEFEKIMPRLDKVMTETGATSHTDAFIKLLENYESSRD